WLLRPDRVRVIPDRTKFIGGYQYWLGAEPDILPAEDIIQPRLRNPADDYYGLPPLAVVAGRVDTDHWARSFTRAFFTNDGVPSGLLNVQRAVNKQERDLLRSQWRNELAGPSGWHSIGVVDGTQATYTPMGLPLGARGIALPELDEILEARI